MIPLAIRLSSTHILPHLGTLKVAAVTRDDLARLHGRMVATPYSANRVLSLLSKAFNLAEVWGWRPEHSNPASRPRLSVELLLES